MRIPEQPPELTALFSTLGPDRLGRIVETITGAMAADRYHHWDDLRHRKPPGDLSREEWWMALKMARAPLTKFTPLRSVKGEPFRFCVPDLVQRKLHQIDQNLSGQIIMSEQVTNPATRDRYLVSSLIEEAITSSQLEGASTTRQVASEMLRSGRAPTDKSERMILNNYLAMQRVGELRNSPLTPGLVLELHRLVSQGTLSSPAVEGRLQQPGEGRVAVGRDGGLLHQPPPAEELPARLEAMCAFANGQTEVSGFMHPVLRAIALHFWLAYEHPFEDGNGRTARVLFYWSMLAHKYWLAEFITISTILRNAPAQYAKAFLLTETDDNDLTYFVIYNLEVVGRAIEALRRYLQRKMEEVREAEHLVRQASNLNHRQLALLSHAMRHPVFLYTIESHRTSHRVVYETARTDLQGLEAMGYLTRVKVGRAFGYVPASDLSERIRYPNRAEGPHPGVVIGASGREHQSLHEP